MARRFRRAFYATREQLVYAAALGVGMRAGLVILVASFALYASGLVAPQIAFEDLPRYWNLPVADYLKAAAVPAGWGWLKIIHRSDYLNFLGVAFLATVTIACYARILIYPVRSRDYLFAGMLVAQILVLAVGASGILGGGH